jgi:hypothetical protein
MLDQAQADRRSVRLLDEDFALVRRVSALPIGLGCARRAHHSNGRLRNGLDTGRRSCRGRENKKNDHLRQLRTAGLSNSCPLLRIGPGSSSRRPPAATVAVLGRARVTIGPNRPSPSLSLRVHSIDGGPRIRGRPIQPKRCGRQSTGKTPKLGRLQTFRTHWTVPDWKARPPLAGLPFPAARCWARTASEQRRSSCVNLRC